MGRIRHTTAGESHGPSLTVIVEGLPAGLGIGEESIRADLARRQIPLGAGARMSIETDRARITAGVMQGFTTGAPLAMEIPNANHEAWKGKTVPALTTPRPGHADFAAAVKYGYNDIRQALERASARETAARVAAGACCRALLREFGIEVEGRVAEIAGETDDAAIEAAIAAARAEGETLGGTIEVRARGVPPGLGSHVSARERLDGRIAAALMSIPAVKGVEIGGGFALARMKGTAAQAFSGGITGGVSDGSDITARVAMKPIPTTLKPQKTVDLATGEPAETVYERSDVCPVPRAVVVAEAALCSVLADALLEKTGGDSIAEIRPRFEALPKTVRLDPSGKVFWP